MKTQPCLQEEKLLKLEKYTVWNLLFVECILLAPDFV